MPRPPADVVTELTWYWWSVSIHEAGHAVIAVVLDLEIDRARLEYKKSWWNGDWSVMGSVTWNDKRDDDPDAILVACLAGAETESIACPEIPRRQILDRCVEDKKLSKGFLRNASLTRSQGERLAARLAHEQWSSIERVAAALRKKPSLHRREIERLVR